MSLVATTSVATLALSHLGGKFGTNTKGRSGQLHLADTWEVLNSVVTC